MIDYYLEDTTRLNGQPKRTISDYVESQGVLVPRRFATLEEARRSRVKVIARSEHEQDYDGVSDLGESFVLSKDHNGLQTLSELTRYAFQNSHKQQKD